MQGCDFGLIKENNSNFNPEEFGIAKVEVPSSHLNSKTNNSHEGGVTQAVGTKIFASPEQWEGDKDKFDFKADIFSLGVVFLLLFHPIRTSMEQLQVITDSKNGKLPAELENNLPEIAKLIRKMLAVDPCKRPSLEMISLQLRLPVETDIQLSGNMTLKKEDLQTWDNKYFKLIGKNLYIFNNEHAKKAETVYLLSDWSVLLEKTSDHHTDEASPSKSCITLEDPMKLGCTFRMETCEETTKLFNQLQKCVA